MKKSVGKVSIITTALSMLLGVPLIVLTNKGVTKVDGYSASSLPTTIDLNDTTEANIRSYYSSLNNLSTAERQGTNLLKNLKTILKNGQKYYSYENGTSIWQMYEITDRDWDKSPASSTTYGTYNSTTNKITGYTYGTSSSSSKNNPYIHALYINRDVNNQTTAWDNHNQDQWGINREHVWPKAEGFDSSGAGGARGDPMHLMAGNGYANNIHSNYYYGYVKTSGDYTDCGNKYSNQSGNLRGTSKTLNSGTVFEPQDCDKGDIARAIFYMVARYNYLSGSDSDGIDTNNPNLTLTQNISDWSSSGYTSSTSTQGKLGVLTDLLAWHHADPVDEYEKHRNNLLYTNFTNNRNPFIDFPEWVDFIWGTATYNGTTYQSYSSTPTGYATPSSDTINGYNSGGSTDPVSVTGVTLAKDSTTIEVGGSEVLSYTIAPSNATNQGVTWTSSNTSVATVSSSGRVVGVAEGNATITIRTSDGNFTDTCIVTVTESSSGSSEGTDEGSVEAASGALSGWTASGTGTAYADGSVKFDGSGDNVYKTDIFSADIASGMTSLTVTINSKINGTPVETNSYRVEAIDSSGNVLTTLTKTGADVVTDSYGDTVFSFNSNLTGCTGIKITYVTKGSGNWGIKKVSWSATYSSEEQEVTLSSIAVKTAPTKLTYTAGDDFVPAGLIITATYSDASSVDIPYENNEDSFEFDPSENLQTSDTSVTISYGGRTCSQSITVTASSKTLSSISVSDQTTCFNVGDTFEFDGVVTATYSDASNSDVTSLATFSGYNMSQTGSQTVTVSYTYGNVTKTTTYQITVAAAPVVGTVSQRVVSKSNSSYFETGSIYLTGTTSSGSASCDGFTITQSKVKDSATSVAYTYDEIRVYANHSLMIEPKSGYQIDSVILTANTNDYASAVGGTSVTNCSKSVSGSTVTLTPTVGTQTIGFTNSVQSRLNYVTVNYSSLISFSLVTSLDSVKTNDEIMFVGNRQNYSTYFSATEYDTNNQVLTADSISVANNSVTNGGGFMTFTIVRDGTSFSFANEDGKYLSSSASPKVYFEDSINNSYSKFSLSIANNGQITMSVNSTYLRFNYNSGNSRISCYSSSTYGGPIYIFKKTFQVEADTWSSTFLSQTTNCNVSNWSSLASTYGALSEGAKSEIITCEANSSEDYSLRSQAMARYDYILSDPRFNSGLSTFVTGRSVSPARPNLIPMILSGENSNVAIIIIISLVSVSTVGGYFFLKSRKKEEL